MKGIPVKTILFIAHITFFKLLKKCRSFNPVFLFQRLYLFSIKTYGVGTDIKLPFKGLFDLVSNNHHFKYNTKLKDKAKTDDEVY